MCTGQYENVFTCIFYSGVSNSTVIMWPIDTGGKAGVTLSSHSPPHIQQNQVGRALMTRVLPQFHLGGTRLLEAWSAAQKRGWLSLPSIQ